ncbi:MAG TPA: hypothetical protein VH370_24405 [Humisphaera sp.]|nr:hypothetical protein [Humisphaera sp.]
MRRQTWQSRRITLKALRSVLASSVVLDVEQDAKPTLWIASCGYRTSCGARIANAFQAPG